MEYYKKRSVFFVLLSCLAITGAAPTPETMDRRSVKWADLPDKAKKFEKELTSLYWTKRATAIADLNSNCEQHKDDIIGGLVYAASSAYATRGATSEGAKKLFDSFYTREDTKPIRSMLLTIATYGQDVKYKVNGGEPNKIKFTCPSAEEFEFGNRLAVTDSQTSEITLSPILFGNSTTKTKSSRSTRVGYTLLKELPQLHNYAKVSKWPKDTACGSTESYAACPEPEPETATTKFSQSLVADAQKSVCTKTLFENNSVNSSAESTTGSQSPLKSVKTFATYVFLTVSSDIYKNDVEPLTSQFEGFASSCAQSA